MKILRSLLLSLMTLISVATARDGIPIETTNELIGLIRSSLPKGWKVEFEADGKLLSISRPGRVRIAGAFPSSRHGQVNEMSYRIYLWLMPAVSAVEHRRLHAGNLTIEKLSEMFFAITGKRMSPKFDIISPETAEQKAAVPRFEALEKSLHRLPQYSFRDLGLEEYLKIYGQVIDEQIRKECEQVERDVMKLLTKYEFTQELPNQKGGATVDPTPDLPVAIPVTGEPGYVRSPHAPDRGKVDVTGIPSGTKVDCPFTQKVFRVP